MKPKAEAPLRRLLRPLLLGPLLTSLPMCLLSACAAHGEGSPAPAQGSNFPVVISARSAGRGPVSGVSVWQGKRLLGTTDAAGSVRIALQGVEGDSTALDVKCPAAYASPEQPLRVGLRRLGNGSTAARFEVECFSLLHTVVVGVRAENGQNLPILRLKHVVGHTDDAGVAHVLLEAAADEAIALTLDTSKNAVLLPQNPTLDFVTRDSDELVLLSAKFMVKRAPQKRAVPRRIPTPL